MPATFPPISEQIRRYQVRTGDSQRDLARRSVRSGHPVTQRYIGDLVSGTRKRWPLKVKTFAGLAAAIETTPRAIVLGYAAELGVEGVIDSDFATRLPPGVDDLPEAVREALLGLLWAVTTGGSVRRFLPDDVELTDEDIPSRDVTRGPPRYRPGSSEQQ